MDNRDNIQTSLLIDIVRIYMIKELLEKYIEVKYGDNFKDAPTDDQIEVIHSTLKGVIFDCLISLKIKEEETAKQLTAFCMTLKDAVNEATAKATEVLSKKREA